MYWAGMVCGEHLLAAALVAAGAVAAVQSESAFPEEGLKSQVGRRVLIETPVEKLWETLVWGGWLAPWWGGRVFAPYWNRVFRRLVRALPAAALLGVNVDWWRCWVATSL